MLKGEAPYDNAVVQKSLATIADGSKKLPVLFPDTSKTGGDTAALPKIWEDKAAFDDPFRQVDRRRVGRSGIDQGRGFAESQHPQRARQL